MGIVAMPDGGDLTYKQCSAAAASMRLDVWIEDLNAGKQWCVSTPLGRYGAIRLIRDWTPASVTISIIVWEPTS
jgi:hypothetical protein